MTFLEALKTGRPIRRNRGCSAAYITGPWIILGERWVLGQRRDPWLRIDTGEEITLASWDYLADDWAVMP